MIYPKLILATALLFIASSSVTAEDKIPDLLNSVNFNELAETDKNSIRGETFPIWRAGSAYKWAKEHGGSKWWPVITNWSITIVDPNPDGSIRWKAY